MHADRLQEILTLTFRLQLMIGLNGLFSVGTDHGQVQYVSEHQAKHATQKVVTQSCHVDKA